MRVLPGSLAAGLAIATLSAPFSAKAATFSGLNIFGDSLVDSGNFFNVTSALGVGLPPSPPYAQRSTNGPLWIEIVSAELGLAPVLLTELDPTLGPQQITDGINLGYAGALSSSVHVADDQFPFTLLPDALLLGLQEQVAVFAQLALPAAPDALYVVWAGGNDYNAAFFDPAAVGETPLAALPNAVTDNLQGSITTLANLGARNFLVPNLPPLGLLPFADTLDAASSEDIPALLNQLSAAHNQLLKAKLDALARQKPELRLTLLDVQPLFEAVVARPANFGFTNVTDPCLTNFRPGFRFDGVCDTPDEFLFFDDTHPTAAAQRLVAQLALTALNEQDPAAVPEPALVWGLVALGIWAGGRQRLT